MGENSKDGSTGSEIQILVRDEVLNWDLGSSKLTGGWQNSFSSCCRIKVLIFLLAVVQWHYQQLETVPWPMTLKGSLEHESLLFSRPARACFSDFLFCNQLKKTLWFWKIHMTRSGLLKQFPYFIYLWPHCDPWRILVSQPGTEPSSFRWKHRDLPTAPPRNSHHLFNFNQLWTFITSAKSLHSCT